MKSITFISVEYSVFNTAYNLLFLAWHVCIAWWLMVALVIDIKICLFIATFSPLFEHNFRYSWIKKRFLWQNVYIVIVNGMYYWFVMVTS